MRGHYELHRVGDSYLCDHPPPSYTLTVALAGTGSGSVTGSGISCPGICSDSYPAGTMVTLTGAAELGSSFAGWSGGGCSGTGTCTVTMSSGQSVTATFATNGTGSAVGPGRYTVVTLDNRQLPGNVVLRCAVGQPAGCDRHEHRSRMRARRTDRRNMFYLPEVPVNASGTFSQEIHKEQILKGVMAKYTYVLTGSETGSEISGSFREDIVYNDGLNTNARRTTCPGRKRRKVASLPSPCSAAEGSYNGGDPQSRSFQEMTFYVSPVGNLQDVVVTATFLHCTPSAEVGDRLELPEVTVGAGGSFSAEKEVECVFQNTPAKFAYALSGHVHSAAANGEPPVTGIFREQNTYNNGTKRTCSTDDVYFKAARTETGAKSLPAQEALHGGRSAGSQLPGNVVLRLRSGNLQDVVVTASDLNAHQVNRSATLATSAKPTSTATARLRRRAPRRRRQGRPRSTHMCQWPRPRDGAERRERVDGIFREEIAYNDRTSHTCSTNNHYWMASREENRAPSVCPPGRSHSAAIRKNAASRK